MEGQLDLNMLKAVLQGATAFRADFGGRQRELQRVDESEAN